MKQVLLLFFAVGLVHAGSSLYSLQHNGVDTQHSDGKKYHVEREVPSQCLDVPITTSAIWEGDFAGKEVPDACKASFVQTVGVIYPLHIKEGVETFAELEVLRFIQQMQDRKDYLLVDTRGADWYDYETIPSATNLWLAVLKKPKVFDEEFAEMLQQIGVKKSKDGKYDFSDAKTLLLFCNGPWCGQSPIAIVELLKMGYPAEKLKWYRGGLHGWKGLSLTTTRTH